MSPDVVAALGALLSGIGSVLGGIIAIRIAQRRSDKACDERIRQAVATYERGLELGARLGEHETPE